jgi:hypothetical protein
MESWFIAFIYIYKVDTVMYITKDMGETIIL